MKTYKFTSLLLDDVLLSAVSFNNLNRYIPFQTSVMHQVLENPDEKYWNNSNIEKCTLDSLKRLHQGLKEDKIPDVFFNNVNLLDRVKDKKLQSECVAHLERLLKNYERTGNISDIFPTAQSAEPKSGGRHITVGGCKASAGSAKSVVSLKGQTQDVQSQRTFSCPNEGCERKLKSQTAVAQHITDGGCKVSAGSSKSVVSLKGQTQEVQLQRTFSCPNKGCERKLKSQDAVAQHITDGGCKY